MYMGSFGEADKSILGWTGQGRKSLFNNSEEGRFFDTFLSKSVRPASSLLLASNPL